MEKRRKFAWNKYFQLRKEFIQLAIESLLNSKEGVLNIKQKRLIRNMYFNQVAEDKQCAICLEEVKKDMPLCFLICGHIFMKDCIDKHIGACENSMLPKTCPFCRESIDIVQDL
jgi:hypothetical protein